MRSPTAKRKSLNPPAPPPRLAFDQDADCLLEKLPESFVRRLVDYLADFDRAQLFVFIRRLTKLTVWDRALRVRDNPFAWEWIVERDIPQFQVCLYYLRFSQL